jgi:hypothetical protein
MKFYHLEVRFSKEVAKDYTSETDCDQAMGLPLISSTAFLIAKSFRWNVVVSNIREVSVNLLRIKLNHITNMFHTCASNLRQGRVCGVRNLLERVKSLWRKPYCFFARGASLHTKHELNANVDLVVLLGAKSHLALWVKYVHTYIPLTLYPRRGSRGISNIPPRHPRFTKIR